MTERCGALRSLSRWWGMGISVALITVSVFALTDWARAADGSDQLRGEIDTAWQTLRDAHPTIRHRTEGVLFTNRGAMGTDESGKPVPPEAATYPARFAWAIDFANRRFRREQSLHLFYRDRKHFDRHDTTYVFSGGTGSELMRHFADDKARREATEPLVELSVNRRADMLLEYDKPVLWSCGYAPRGEGTSIVEAFRPATTSDFTDVRESEDDRTPGRRIVILRTPCVHPTVPSPYHEVWTAPALGYRVVQHRQWFEGKLFRDVRLEYSQSPADRIQLTAVTSSTFGASGPDVLYNFELKTSQADTGATASSELFVLQPQPFMWVLDEATNQVQRHLPPRFGAWLVLLAIAVLVVVTALVVFRNLRRGASATPS